LRLPLFLTHEDVIRYVNVEGEERWHAIGAVEQVALLVVYAYRNEGRNGEEEIIRIISARGKPP